jgi:hypothetical protein
MKMSRWGRATCHMQRCCRTRPYFRPALGSLRLNPDSRRGSWGDQTQISSHINRPRKATAVDGNFHWGCSYSPHPLVESLASWNFLELCNCHPHPLALTNFGHPMELTAPAATSCSIKKWHNSQSDWPIRVCHFELLWLNFFILQKGHFLASVTQQDTLSSIFAYSACTCTSPCNKIC